MTDALAVFAPWPCVLVGASTGALHFAASNCVSCVFVSGAPRGIPVSEHVTGSTFCCIERLLERRFEPVVFGCAAARSRASCIATRFLLSFCVSMTVTSRCCRISLLNLALAECPITIRRVIQSNADVDHLRQGTYALAAVCGRISP